MAALRSLLGKIRIPGAAPLRASRAFASSSSLPKGDLERALLLKNNIGSAATEADLFSSADLLAEHADETVRAMSQVVDKHEAIVEEFCTLSYKLAGSAVVLGCIDGMLEYYWKDKPDPDLEFIASLEAPE